MGSQSTLVEQGQLDPELAVDAPSKQKKGGLKAAPSFKFKSVTVGLGAIAKARAILQAVTMRAKASREWLLNLGTGFNLVKDINQAIDEDGEVFLEIPIEMEEEGPEGVFTTVSRMPNEVKSIFETKINAYLNWGDEDSMKALDALDREQPSEEDVAARQDPVVQKLIRRAAHTALWLFKLSEVKTLEELDGLIADFYQPKGYLEEAGSDEIQAEARRIHGGGKHRLIRGPESKFYKFTNDNRYGRMGDDQFTVEEIFGRATELFASLRKKEGQDERKKEDEILEKSAMEIADLWENRPHGNGLCGLTFFTKESRPQRRVLQVHLDENGFMRPVNASDRIMDAVRDAQEMKLRIPLNSLKDSDGNLLYPDELPPMKAPGSLEGDDWERFVRRRKAFYRFRDLVHHAFECWITEQNQPRIQTENSRPQRIEKPKAKSVSPEVMRVIQQDLGYVGTITAIEWIVEGKPGDAVLVIPEWSEGKDVFEVLAIRMRRTHRDGKSFIMMTNAWHKANDFFAGLKEKEFEEIPRSRFQGVEEPLGKFLRKCWKKTKFPAQ